MRVATEGTVRSYTVATIAVDTTVRETVRPVAPGVRREGWARAQEIFL